MGIIAIKQEVMRKKLCDGTVICRVGSLEKKKYQKQENCNRYLPSRQFRNTFAHLGEQAVRYLPSRQFRKR